MQLFRCVQIRITAADPARILSLLAENNISIHNTVVRDLLTVDICINEFHYPTAERLFISNDIRYIVTGKPGILWCVRYFIKRPVLVVGLLIFLITAITLPNRILFFRVTGNQQIPSDQILCHADEAGMKFLSKSSLVRSENIKNQLLTRIPQLQWVGITTSGCVATIHVRERSDWDETNSIRGASSTIVAACDGIVSDLIIHSGTPLVHIGQLVNSGDILVSGYTNFGQTIKVGNANAEAFAYTKRNFLSYTIKPILKHGKKGGRYICYKLKLGKKVINLCNHSRISDASCVKMYECNYCYFPGGFRLPIAFIKETWIEYQVDPVTALPDTVPQWLPVYMRNYLQDQTIAARILQESYQWEFAGDYGQLSTIYSCHEMIGRLKYEENIIKDAEDN